MGIVQYPNTGSSKERNRFGVAHQFKSPIICYEALDDVQARLYRHFQNPDESNTTCFKH